LFCAVDLDVFALGGAHFLRVHVCLLKQGLVVSVSLDYRTFGGALAIQVTVTCTHSSIGWNLNKRAKMYEQKLFKVETMYLIVVEVEPPSQHLVYCLHRAHSRGIDSGALPDI